ncbi:MAG: hypothetical protein Q8L06_14390 [Pseudohongiella sp.]|nr:hypothetical protein [Pseudohongiella sp.]
MIKFRQAVGITVVFVLVGLLFAQVIVSAIHADSMQQVIYPFFLTLLISLLSSLNQQHGKVSSAGIHLIHASIVASGVLAYFLTRDAVSGGPLVWQQVPAVVLGAAFSVFLIGILRHATQGTE